MTGRLRILNTWVDPLNKKQVIERIKSFLAEGDRPHSIFAVNPEKSFSIGADGLLHETFKTADLLVPDGIGIVLAAKILHRVKLTRIPGVELMQDICDLAAKNGHSVFIYGSVEPVNKGAGEILSNRYQGLKIAGRSNGYVSREEMPRLIDEINKSRADILFLALGSPRQELWFTDHKGSLENVRICQGIGGTLDTIVGKVKRAPKIWQNLGGEWLYRLISDPRRIRRQKVLPLFTVMVLFTWFRKAIRDI